MGQLNRNASYLFEVAGITVWERLRVIRNFLLDRKLAKKVNDLAFEKQKELIEIHKDSTDINTKYDLLEAQILNEQVIKDIKHCEDEIQFLEKLEAALTKEAEKTRIPGKTDEEMYEMNYLEEMAQQVILQAQAQILTSGTISNDLMLTLMKNPYAMNRAIESGVITHELPSKLNLIGFEPVFKINNSQLKLLGEDKNVETLANNQ